MAWEYGELPRQSVWLVIDVASGEYTMAAPPGSQLREIDLTTEDLVYESSVLVGVSQENVRYLEALLAQSGSGIWRQTSGDGSPNDDDGQVNGKIVIRFESMKAGEGTPEGELPETPIIGDVVAVVDALELKIGVHIIGGKAASTAEAGEEVAQ